MKKTPMRMCVACRQMQPKNSLVRVVRGTDDKIIIDRTGKANGRGAYLCPKLDCLNKAVKIRALERALEKSISPEVIELLKEEFMNEPKAE